MARSRATAWNNLIRRAIRASGLSLYAVARDSGVDVAPIQRFMAGEHGMTVETAERISSVVGLELRCEIRGKAKRG